MALAEEQLEGNKNMDCTIISFKEQEYVNNAVEDACSVLLLPMFLVEHKLL